MRVCGVDSSTQSTKVVVRDAETGQSWGRGTEPHPPTAPPRSEQDPQSWWAALIQAFHRAGRYDIGAMSVAAQQHGMVVADEAGAVIRPAKLWNDTESAHDAEELTGALGASAWVAACGSLPTASFTVTKLAWLKRNEPDGFARVRRIGLPHDWLTQKLTGRWVTDRGDASSTGYWSPAEGRYRTDLLALVDDTRPWIDHLPAVLAPTEPAGPLIEMAALPLGLDALDDDVLVAPGTGDNMAAALGIGMAEGDVAISLGTSGTVFSVSGVATADATGAVAGFADASGRFLPLVCTLNCTKATDAIGRLLGVDHAELAALALASPAGARGTVLVPYLDGERTPNRPAATGLLTGFRSDATREQVARAAFEGVVCALLDGIDALARAGVDVARGRVFLVGGGARSPAYTRVVVDLLQRPVTVPDPQAEHVATGAAVQAAAVLLGWKPDELAAAWGLGRGEVIEPDTSVDAAAVRQAYAAARDAMTT